jgi:two-component system OmpR family sensor kinase
MRLPFVRGVRGRLLLAIVLAMAAALAALTAGFNAVVAGTLERNADNVLRERATAELRILRPIGGRLRVQEAPDDSAVDSPVWIFSRGQALEEPPRATGTLEAAARSLAGGPAKFVTVPRTETRLYAAPVVSQGKRLGTLVVGISLAPSARTTHTALLGSLVLAVLVLAIVAFAARWLLKSALRPVAQMTAAAAAWSERDLDRRFELGEPYDELTSLGATLDDLLDRLAASLRRERRFSAELSHELRTPLASIVAEAELALRREREPREYRDGLEIVLRNARQLTRTVEALVAAAQHEAVGTRGTADAYAVAADTVEACAGLAAERAIELSAKRPPTPVRVGVDEDFAERILQPIVENACRYARGRVGISIERTGSRMTYVVQDDGPGVALDEREGIFDPGVRGSAGSVNGGAGLGLALARRLARSASGDVEAAAAEQGGRFVVTLPAA